MAANEEATEALASTHRLKLKPPEHLEPAPEPLQQPAGPGAKLNLQKDHSPPHRSRRTSHRTTLEHPGTGFGHIVYAYTPAAI